MTPSGVTAGEKRRSLLGRYWHAYGGIAALFTSRYLYTALLLTPFCWGSWSEPHWWNTVIEVLPSLLGFTLGGFAIFVGFGNERFRESLADTDDDPDVPSVYIELCATFAHFIVVQILALLVAIVSKGMWFEAPLPRLILDVLPTLNVAWGAVAYAIFLYALTSVIAIGFHIFRLAGMFETHQRYTARSHCSQQDQDRG